MQRMNWPLIREHWYIVYWHRKSQESKSCDTNIFIVMVHSTIYVNKNQTEGEKLHIQDKQSLNDANRSSDVFVFVLCSCWKKIILRFLHLSVGLICLGNILESVMFQFNHNRKHSTEVEADVTIPTLLSCVHVHHGRWFIFVKNV